MRFIVIVILSIACTTTQLSERNIEGVVYRDLHQHHRLFFQKPVPTTVKEKIDRWNQEVEGKYRLFYDRVVWSDAATYGWKEGRLMRLGAAFKLYERYPEQIFSAYETFPKALETTVAKFKKDFPQIDLKKVRFFLLPMGFDIWLSRSGLLPGADRKEYWAIFFSPESLFFNPGQMEATIAYELFRAYQIQLLGGTVKQELSGTKNYYQRYFFEHGLAAHYVKSRFGKMPRAVTPFDVYRAYQRFSRAEVQGFEGLASKLEQSTWCYKASQRFWGTASCNLTLNVAAEVGKELERRFGFNRLLNIKSAVELNHVTNIAWKSINKNKRLKPVIQAFNQGKP